jgi:septal ring factor EnvC (AmiA/AmiB activator)
MPNLKIGIKEHDFLRKIITEKYQQKAPTWSSGGNLNNYNNIAKNIRLSVKKQNDSLSVSPHQMQKLFTYHGESTYREDFIEACYLYCELKRDAPLFTDDPSEDVIVDETLQQEVEDFKMLLQESENRADALQKEADHYMEQNIQLELTAKTQKEAFEAAKMQLDTQNELIKKLNNKITAQNEHNDTLKEHLTARQNQLLVLELKLTEQAKALHHYVSLLHAYKTLMEHQKKVWETDLQNLKQTIAALNDENRRLAMEKTVGKKPKKTLAAILSII